MLQDALATKRLGLFKEAAPRISKVAFLTNPDHADNELREARCPYRLSSLTLPCQGAGRGSTVAGA